MIPPGPSTLRPGVAVGCESGVVVYDLETGRRTRMFAGHSGPVVSLVPSPDGRWLGSSSLDQTIMIYPLAGCDSDPASGQVPAAAVIEPGSSPALNPRVRRQHGPAAWRRDSEAGIAQGQALPTYYASDTMAGFVGLVDELRPGLDTIAVWVKRDQAEVVLRTTKRNPPLLSLLVSRDGEWIMWTNQGFFDSSIAGDQLLGWQRNISIDRPVPVSFRQPRTYEKKFRRPDLIENIVKSADANVIPPIREGDEWFTRPHRLEILAMGLSQGENGRGPPMHSAEEDVLNLTETLSNLAGRVGFGQVDSLVLTGEGATSRRLRLALADLGKDGRLVQGDTMVVMIETPLLTNEEELNLGTFDGALPSPVRARDA